METLSGAIVSSSSVSSEKERDILTEGYGRYMTWNQIARGERLGMESLGCSQL